MRTLTQLSALTASLRRMRWSPDRLLLLQDERLKLLVRHAYKASPLYRALFDRAGMKPDEVGGIAALAAIPPIQKEDLQAEGMRCSDRFPRRSEPTVTLRTSGSTGTPLVIPYRERDATELNVSWLRPLFAHGVMPWHVRFEITGPHNFPAGRQPYERFGLWRRRCVSVFEDPGAWLDAARATRADYLWGYSGSLKLLAQYLLEHGHAAPPFRAVFGVSDLVDPACRRLVREAFGRPLVDVYGAAEAGCIAWQCPTCDGYHVNMDTVIVEILDGDRPAASGVAGRVVVTNLLSFAMPVIRYELGDVAAMSARAPACGRGLPLMEVVEGRSNAFVRLPSGRLLSPMFFFGLMKRFEDDLRAWRVIQDSEDRLSVLAVPARPALNTAPIVEEIRRVAGEPIGVDVVTVDALPPEPAGKARAVFSRLASGARP